MKRIFDMNNPVMRALSVVADLLLLNLLTVLCSIPILTAGAAYTALNHVLIQMVRGEEGYIARPYFAAFRANLKKGSAMGLLFLGAALLLYLDDLAAQAFAPPFAVGIRAIGVILLATAIYAFALLARYENSLLGTLKNAVSLMIGFFPRTLGMLVFVLGVWVAALRYIQLLAPVMLLLGLALPCYVCVLVMQGVFEKLEQA